MSPRPSPQAVALGSAIRDRRRSLKLSQRSLGALIGRSQAWVAKVEAGDLKVAFADAIKVAVALDLAPADLLAA